MWGRSAEDDPAVPLHYPLLAVLAIATSIAPTTWFLSEYHGYLLSGSALCLIILYGVLFTDRRISIDTGFLVLFGGYWLGLLAHYLVLPNPNLLEYVLVTPVAVVGTVVVLPRLIESRRQAFAMGLTLLSVAVMLIGVWMLWRTHTAGVAYPRSPCGRRGDDGTLCSPHGIGVCQSQHLRFLHDDRSPSPGPRWPWKFPLGSGPNIRLVFHLHPKDGSRM